jgi:hypothetical protein
MTKGRLESIALAYWEVGTALRHPKPTTRMSTEEAFEKLRTKDLVRPTEWRLAENIHVLTFDIIEGHTGWREKREAHGSISTLPTRG